MIFEEEEGSDEHDGSGVERDGAEGEEKGELVFAGSSDFFDELEEDFLLLAFAERILLVFGHGVMSLKCNEWKMRNNVVSLWLKSVD